MHTRRRIRQRNSFLPETGRLGPKMEWTEPEADGGFQRIIINRYIYIHIYIYIFMNRKKKKNRVKKKRKRTNI